MVKQCFIRTCPVVPTLIYVKLLWQGTITTGMWHVHFFTSSEKKVQNLLYHSIYSTASPRCLWWKFLFHICRSGGLADVSMFGRSMLALIYASYMFSSKMKESILKWYLKICQEVQPKHSVNSVCITAILALFSS